MENEVVEAQKIMTDAEIRQQQIPLFNSEFIQANGITQKIINRFWKKIDFPENLVDSCWEWNAAKDKKGYGQFWTGSLPCGAHRFSYMIFKGEIGEGLCIRHTCNNTSCVNPHHLLIGTQQDNIDDRNSQNRQAKGEDHGRAILIETEVKEILNKLIAGVTISILAEHYNMTTSPIYLIAVGTNWKHIYNKLTEEQKQKIKYNIDNNMIIVNKQTKVKSEDVWTAKLTEVIVDEILIHLLQKVSVSVLAIQYNVSESNLRNISVGRIWKKCYAKLTVEQKQKIKENLKGLSSDDTKRIRELYKTMSQVKLAKQFNFNVATIRKVIKKIPPYNY